MCFSSPKVSTPEPSPAPPAPEPIPDSVAPNERSMMRGYNLSGRKAMSTYRTDVLNVPNTTKKSGLNVSA